MSQLSLSAFVEQAERLDRTLPSNLKDPFRGTKVTNIKLEMDTWFDNKPRFKGQVWFKNGETQGIQDFTGEDFKDLAQKMDIFLKKLPQ